MIDTVTGIGWIIETLRKEQSPDGSWAYPFDTGISTDAYMIILLRTLEIDDEELIEGLCRRILSKQQQNGAWKLFYDEGEGNVTSTVEAYYGLLFSGLYRKEDERLRAAKKFILAHGGLSEVSMFTKIMLALTGQYQWPSFTPLPIEMILLPPNFPINFYSFSVFGRANLTPIMILADQKFSMKTVYSPDLSDLKWIRGNEEQWVRSREWRSLLSCIQDGVKRLIGIPGELRRLALERARTYMLDHLEQDGTFYSYYSSTFLMIFALLSLGYKKTDPIITKAVEGIRAMKCEINGLPHLQYTTANVWNTSLIGYTLQAAGVSHEDPMVTKANKYLLSRQHYRFGDWVVHNPNGLPGGWGFSDVNTMNPDVDDTTASLRSISRIASQHPTAWARGISWLLPMQNDNGGWAAFEKNTDSKLLEFLPLEKGRFLLLDPPCADLTGRTLEFLGNYTNRPASHAVIRNAVHWLLKDQRKDGSWYGRWGICYIYGTWGAVTGLKAAGVSKKHPSMQKAAAWLKSIQNADGGWGESCRSDIQMTYVSLTTSTLTDTAWALDALIAIADRPTTAIQKGITFLLDSLEKEDWTTDYPKGQGMGGAFYIHYHSYRYIFPLLALAHYRNKFE
ncbi:squalene--hopene cyclase [Paenibacillus thiaminolyticus]|uniref:Squalene--hopene cyclase n=1 Tax=Paenibacillus thiaminolyticus TaxID=49283 RepID=A0AAP9J435_PANTH|nr:squalene--hopene cyclase [Paenibacillus thiaminolyticus]MCY9534186.1 squalene--hopene cyclase [Paenibacillus thiaminolyticus]MCY9604705.1 squalene--hopene cyclase [Paenibacillus thiaminolyticus]MCY9610136.1 squalene--hopene cyclase [Paenibacillus thiaminolyticus]MCY9614645.1 squalene--hopene cyclase [Paenibacillus thiaminolyticus]MCY9621830.1 squalene--hopene cyclase [Paenibacillus thiaminolyticus]